MTLDLWNRFFATPHSFHGRPITRPMSGGAFKGTAVLPLYVVYRLTKEFGPAGQGWWIEIDDERVERFPEDGTVMHILRIRLCYRRGEITGNIVAFGCTKWAYKARSGYLVDEDAPKKSLTDALTKAASWLGIAGDVHAGLWDDSKYVATRKSLDVADEDIIDQAPAEDQPADAPQTQSSSLPNLAEYESESVALGIAIKWLEQVVDLAEIEAQRPNLVRFYSKLRATGNQPAAQLLQNAIKTARQRCEHTASADG